MMTDLLFYGCAGLMMLFSVLVVTVPNLLHAAISLIASFFVTACLYILLGMEFVALAQIMIYIGGIVIFIIITILLTSQLGGRNLYPKTPRQRLWGGVVAGSVLAGVTPVLYLAVERFERLAPVAADREPGSLARIGLRLLDRGENGFVVPFEIISLLLLVSLIGAMVIARRERTGPGGGVK